MPIDKYPSLLENMATPAFQIVCFPIVFWGIHMDESFWLESLFIVQ